jgi:GT2 family glycosyltransferase
MIELSVVVPTYRRPALLERCLTSLWVQTLDADRYEVVAVDDGSGDQTADVLREAARTSNVRPIIQPENRGPAAARNRGVAEARGDLICFIDDDVVAAPDLLAQHLRFHAQARDERLGVLGRIHWEPHLRVTSFMRWLDRSGLQFGYDTWLREGAVDPPYAAFYTANLSMSRQLLLDAGGFDERFPYPAYEDMELAYRLAERGFRLDYRPAAVGFHARAIDLRTFCQRMTHVAEAAALLRAVQPDFPIDEEPVQCGAVRRRDRLALGLQSVVARPLGRDRVLDRHYRAKIAAAYQAGQARAVKSRPASFSS